MATTELSRLAPAASRRWSARAEELAKFWAVARAKLSDWSRAETERLALWTPVAIGSGAAMYFALKAEPAAWAGLVALFVVGGLWLNVRSARRWSGAAFLIALGFVGADWRASRVEAPILARELKPTDIVGRLASVDEAAKSRRLVIDLISIAGVETADLPKRARVTWRGAEFKAMPGDVISLRAGLSPPPPPVAPGAFDFARQLYFDGIGAVGYAVTPPEIAAAAKPTIANRGAAAIERARLTLARRILEEAPGQGGAIVAAVVTGKRGAINEDSERRLRDSGLAHLLAISGLHMGLATGLIFFVVRFGLALIEPVAIRYPIKKWAATAALISGVIYLLLSGAGWSAQRAFIMWSIFFVAILADRRAISLRNVAIAATVILVLAPEAILHPGFQMSFAAVTALIAAYEWHAARADPARSFLWPARLRRYFVGIVATDLITAFAATPYCLYHFKRDAMFSLAGNVIAIPIMAFFVMPAAILALLLMPLGFDGFAWRLSALGVDAILAVGGWVADLPGAVVTFAQWPPAALGILTLGGLWLCLQKEAWRLGGLAAIPVAAIFIALAPAPSLFVSEDGSNVAAIVRDGEGAERHPRALALFNPRKDKFAARAWKEFSGLDWERVETRALSDFGSCDPAGCVAKIDSATVAVSSDPLGLADDCARADLVVALYPVRSKSAASACAATLIDRDAAWNNGAHAVWIKGGKPRIRTVNDARGQRPWTGDAN